MKTAQGISYQTRVSVYLDGRLIGEIRENANGYAYHPTGSTPGDTFATIAGVKNSLESEP